MNDKTKATIISKYGSWEEYLKQRYHTPEARANQLKAASAGGKKSGNRPFSDPKKASEASLKRHYGKGEYGMTI